MFRRTQSFARTIPIIGLVTAIVAVTGCSGGSGSGGTGLESALARVADTANNRLQITYDNTAELVQVAGKNPESTKGFAELRGWGAPGILDNALFLPGENAGFDLFAEDYSISAGFAPRMVTLMAGGQSSSRITSTLTKLGWKRSGGRLVGPSALSGNTNVGTLPLEAAQVQPSDSDVVFGESAASLSQIGSPQGATLASDPTISALAQCLGNVVVATILSGNYTGGKSKPVEVAVGLTQPASNTSTPHAVVCASWSSQAAAASYAANLRKAFSGGLDEAQDEPYSKVLAHATVTTVGGSQHVVEWQADTPQNVAVVFDMVNIVGLPALQECAKLSAAQAHVIAGC